jgi:hypothetical protein
MRMTSSGWGVTAALAVGPYLLLKLAWLGGSTIGITGPAGTAEMTGSRFVVGNVITVGLMLVAVAFVVALTRPSARRVPGWLVLVLGAGATGLLVPILLGLPAGLVVQQVMTGSAGPSDEGLAPWVYGVVYGGFGLLAVAMAAVAAQYVVGRWRHVVEQPPPRPGPATFLLGAAGLLPFGVAMTTWGLLGPGASGPQGMELPAQRTVLAVSGALAIAALVAPLLPESARRPRVAWLTVWTGCSVAALQGPTQVLLAQGGEVQPVVAVLALLATPGACVYGLSALRRRAIGAGVA